MSSHSMDWVTREDFGLTENSRDRPGRYLTRNEVYSAMAELENKFNDFAEFLTGGSEWNLVTKALRLSAASVSAKPVRLYSNLEHN